MKISNITLTAQQISGNQTGTGISLNVENGYEYVDGKVTDKVICQKYTVVFPDNAYEKIVVKVKGEKPIITNEQIQQKGGQIKVTLKNLSGKFYRTNSGEYALSCNADSLEVVQ